MATAYFNGQFKPLADIQISPLDRGFLFGDGVYEVIPVYGKHPFQAKAHLERLARSLEAIALGEAMLSVDQWSAIFDRLIADSPAEDHLLYIQITRGAPPIRQHTFPAPADCVPSCLVMISPWQRPSATARARGMRVITQADQRWALGSIKSLNLLANVLAMQTAADQGAQEAILLRDAHIIEGCSSNVFIVKNGQVFTTPEQPAMLSGITRQVVLRLLHQLSIPHQQGPLSADQLESADEIWLTSSTKEVTPVIAVNDQPVGDGQAGPLWHRVFQAYQTQLEADDE